MDRGAWRTTVAWSHKELDATEATQHETWQYVTFSVKKNTFFPSEAFILWKTSVWSCFLMWSDIKWGQICFLSFWWLYLGRSSWCFYSRGLWTHVGSLYSTHGHSEIPGRVLFSEMRSIRYLGCMLSVWWVWGIPVLPPPTPYPPLEFFASWSSHG